MIKLLVIFTFIGVTTFAQKQVSITIDDVPNTGLKHSVLLGKLDSLQIPTTIFINEQKLEHGDLGENIQILESWIKNKYITPGNHTFSHARASKNSFKDYKNEIIKGEIESRKLSNKYNKELKHFRFPYNDLGRDSLQQDSLKQFLNLKGYSISPFTIESSDWMFNSVYKNYSKNNQPLKAKETAETYVNYTLELFDFYDSVGLHYHNRHVKQIYLCHDNELNRDYLDVLIQKLKDKNYSFISFDEALADKVYSQPIYFYKKYGISWFYRWIKDVNERNNMGRKEPTCIKIDKEFEAIK